VSRDVLCARIADIIEKQFPEIAENQPELVARHYTEAGRIEKAASLWGKAGQRSLERSALVEAAEQLTPALGQIAALPATPALRREQIKLQVALVTPLMHVKGFWVASYVAFNGDAMRELASHFLALAERQGTTAPLLIAHRITGTSLLLTGDIAESRAHHDQAITLYDPAEHRPLAMRFGGVDARVAILSYRSWALWLLGYPEAALADAEQALKDARETGQAAALMYALFHASFTHIHCAKYAAANGEADELVALVHEKGAFFWKAHGVLLQGCLLALTGKASEAVQMISAGITALRATGTTSIIPSHLSYLAMTHAEIGQFDDAWRCIRGAMTAVETTKERRFDAEVHRIAGEIARKSPEPDAAKAESYFDRALTVARQQQAKSWELRASMSLARLWRDQGKLQQARDLLAPVCGWFTEGFDTRDLKEAKALSDELAA
jgi:predicted ATPase